MSFRPRNFRPKYKVLGLVEHLSKTGGPGKVRYKDSIISPHVFGFLPSPFLPDRPTPPNIIKRKNSTTPSTRPKSSEKWRGWYIYSIGFNTIHWNSVICWMQLVVDVDLIESRKRSRVGQQRRGIIDTGRAWPRAGHCSQVVTSLKANSLKRLESTTQYMSRSDFYELIIWH